jgi:hypothetical protein
MRAAVPPLDKDKSRRAAAAMDDPNNFVHDLFY